MKKICITANGYAEEMMSAVLMRDLKTLLAEHNLQYELIGGSLISSGKWFEEAGIKSFYDGGMSPSGGFPTRSWGGFWADLKGGEFWKPLVFRRQIDKLTDIKLMIVLGDFFLLTLAHQKNTDTIFIPTAKSDYIQSHYGIEKHYIKKWADISFPRDQKTADDFERSGLPAICFGNLMQDLLNPDAPLIKSDEPVIALLPGSREESYGNLALILDTAEDTDRAVHWAFVQAGSLDEKKINNVFAEKGWKETSKNLFQKNNIKIHRYYGRDFDSIALSCIMAVSLAGTVGDQIAGLGKPVLAYTGTGAQTSPMRMEEYQKLLGGVFLYLKDRAEAPAEIRRLLDDEGERDRLGREGLVRMGARGGSQKIAEYILKNYCIKEQK